MARLRKIPPAREPVPTAADVAVTAASAAHTGLAPTSTGKHIAAEVEPGLAQRVAENTAKKPKKDRTHWLYISVILAIIAGVVFGLLAPQQAIPFSILGTLFIQIIKMIIPPIIFCTIVLGIGSVRSAASVGKAGSIALIYFITMSTVALAVGLVVGNLIHPASDLHIHNSLDDAQSLVPEIQQEAGFAGFLKSLIPTTFFSAFTSGSVLQVLFLALLVGFAVQALGESGRAICVFLGHLQKLVFKILSWIIWLSPIAAFGAIAGVVASTGTKVLVDLGVLILCFYITCVVFIFIVLGAILKIFTGFNIFKLVKYLAREFLLIFATSSSETALPNLMRKMEHMGVEKATVGIVVPTGYSFNLDGTAIYMTMSAIFISNAMDMPMSLGEQVALLAFMIIASKGAAGVSGAGLATLAAGLSSQAPALLSGLPLIVGVDKFMSEARALTNFAGNSVATLLVGTWTRTVDKEQVKRVLDGKDPWRPDMEDSQDSAEGSPDGAEDSHAVADAAKEVDAAKE